MTADRSLLGVDFGTSNTVAVLRWPDGRTRPLLFEGAPLLPSAVLLDERGALHAGNTALHGARVNPERFEPNPKRRIDDGAVLLGDREVPVPELVAAVLGRVADEARRVSPDLVNVVLTHPASWGPRRRGILLAAASIAGLGVPDLVPEPVAAASYFVDVHGSRVPVGAKALVYDLGAGTFDASVVTRTATGFTVLASEGLPDAGGLDVDSTIVAYLGAVYAQRDASVWARLERPVSTADRRARRLLWDDVRSAKETLSYASSTLVAIPLLDEDAPLGREQLERLSRPILDRTVAATVSVIRAAGIRPDDIAGLFLVGGASRMPLVATLLHTAFGHAPTVLEQPELVVAEGSLTAKPQPVVASAPVVATAPLVATAPVVASAPVSPAVPVPVSPAVPVPVSPAVPVPVSPPVAAVLTDLPSPVPPEPSPPPAVAPRRRTPVRTDLLLLLATAVVVAVVLLLASAVSKEEYPVLGNGFGAPFGHPVVYLLPALVLVPLAGWRAGTGLLTGADPRPFWPAVRHWLMVAVGYAAGLGVALALFIPLGGEEWGPWQAAEARAGLVGGLGLLVLGVSLALAARNGLPTRPSRRLGRLAQPALVGLGLGLASVAAAPTYGTFADNAFLTVFTGDESLPRQVVRYAGLAFCATWVVAVSGLVTATARVLAGPQWTVSAPASRWLSAAAGVALVVGGAVAAYAGWANAGG
jgi:hypothetical protein